MGPPQILTKVAVSSLLFRHFLSSNQVPVGCPKDQKLPLALRPFKFDALLRVLRLRDNRGRAGRLARCRRPGCALAAAGGPVQLRAVLVAAAAAAAATAAALRPLALPARGAAAPPGPRAYITLFQAKVLH